VYVFFFSLYFIVLYKTFETGLIFSSYELKGRVSFLDRSLSVVCLTVNFNILVFQSYIIQKIISAEEIQVSYNVEERLIPLGDTIKYAVFFFKSSPELASQFQ
jgi:hypothetical protein